ADHQGEGVYHIRHNHAHVWVEALVEYPGPGGKTERRWLTLDPTPSEDTGMEKLSGLGRWWRSFNQRGGTLWRNFVVEYTPEQQDAIVAEFFAPLAPRRLLGALSDWTS